MVYGVDKLAKYDKDDLWIFTYQTDKARFKDYEKFCNNGRFQKGTSSNLNKQNMNRFLNELREEKKIVFGIDEKEGFKFNYVPSDKIEEIKKLIEDRQIAQGIESLPKEEREKVLAKMRGEDQNKILVAIGQNGVSLIRDIAQKTGFTELKVEETIWGPMQYTGTISFDKEYNFPAKVRRYGLSVLGLYRVLRVNMKNFDVIVEKWGYLHPFVFNRLDILKKYKLDIALKEFILKLYLERDPEPEEETLKRIESYLVGFIISGYNYQYLKSWFQLIHEDQEFSERIVSCFKEYIEVFQQDISVFQYGLETINMLSHRRPNWEEIKWREMPLVGLERFMHFQSIHWRLEISDEVKETLLKNSG